MPACPSLDDVTALVDVPLESTHYEEAGIRFCNWFSETGSQISLFTSVTFGGRAEYLATQSRLDELIAATEPRTVTGTGDEALYFAPDPPGRPDDRYLLVRDGELVALMSVQAEKAGLATATALFELMLA